MKAYVLGYGRLREEEIPEKRHPLEEVDGYGVQFRRTPEWKISKRDVAEMHCRNLQGMRVHRGSHYCEFLVEDLPEGEFAIVCLTHPDFPVLD